MLDEAHLRETAHESIALILEAVSKQTSASTLSGFTGQLGRERARRGVPVEDLVAAVRLDFQVIWSGLLWRATHADMMVLALHVDELWTVIDEYARSVQHSYLDERAAMARSAHDEQQIFLAELFEPAATVPGRLTRIARALDVDADGDFRVAALERHATHDAYRAVQTVTATGAKMFAIRHGDAVLALWPVGNKLRDHATEIQTRSLAGMAAGLVPRVHGLSGVPKAASAACELLAALQPNEQRLLTAEEAWARMSKAHLDLGQEFTSDVLDSLNRLPDVEREPVVAAVAAYLECGSISVTAKTQYCHRNTVLNRLARFRALTGLDVTIPRQAALAVLVLS
ncbi:PucR family transcriptional regulator [Gordonia sp. NPDC003424]